MFGPDERPEPADGVAFAWSRRKAVVTALFGLGCTAFGAGLLLLRAHLRDEGERDPMVKMALIGLLFGGLGPLVVLAGVRKLFRGWRLVVAADRVQVVRAGAVLAQVPFANVAAVRLSDVHGHKEVLLALHDRAADGTFAPAGTVQARSDETHFLFVIADDYQGAAAAVRDAVEAALSAWRAAQPGTGRLNVSSSTS